MNCPNCNIWFPSSESKCHRCGTTLEKDSSSDILVHYCKLKHEEDIPKQQFVDSCIKVCPNCGAIKPANGDCPDCKNFVASTYSSYNLKNFRIKHEEDTPETKHFKRELMKIAGTWNYIINFVSQR